MSFTKDEDEWFARGGADSDQPDVAMAKPRDSKIAAAAAKIPLELIPLQALRGAARVFGYGKKKHGHGNFLLAHVDDGAIDRYTGGFLRHLSDCQQLDGKFTAESLAHLDAESGLPEIDHAICGLVMLRAIAIKCGVLPADPGLGNEPPSKGCS